MRKELSTSSMLGKIFEIIQDEMIRNPALERRIESALKAAYDELQVKERPKRTSTPIVPDIYAEWNSRGPIEFQAWLQREPFDILKEIIRREDMDAARRAAKWKDSEKLAAFITDGLRARMTRGSAFLGKNQNISNTVAPSKKNLDETRNILSRSYDAPMPEKPNPILNISTSQSATSGSDTHNRFIDSDERVHHGKPELTQISDPEKKADLPPDI